MKKVVTIGGGTGSFMLLSGLKEYAIDLTAIVSMADDGGSTGVLRDELGVLPPGDVRQCLVALSDSPDMLRQLMNYRFSEGGLDGHSFGNLFLSALEKITGDFGSAVDEAAEILKVRGRVVPITLSDTRLIMELQNGQRLVGEHAINTSTSFESIGVKAMKLSPRPVANLLAVQSILEADMVVIGPGSHHCAILPSLLVPGIGRALQKTKAIVVYNCNLISKRGQTEGYALEDYVEAIHNRIGTSRIDFVTYNTARPPKRLLKRYEREGGLVAFRQASRPMRSYRVVQADLLSHEGRVYSKGDKIAATRSFIRHDPKKLAQVLMMLLELDGYERILGDIV